MQRADYQKCAVNLRPFGIHDLHKQFTDSYEFSEHIFTFS